MSDPECIINLSRYVSNRYIRPEITGYGAAQNAMKSWKNDLDIRRDSNGQYWAAGIVGSHTDTKWTALVQFRYFYNTMGGRKACSLTCQIKKALAYSK